MVKINKRGGVTLPEKRLNKGFSGLHEWTIWIPLPLPTPQGFFFEAVPKKIADIMSRLRCGVWRTEFVPTACICNTSEISFQHCIFDCPALTNYFTETVNLTIKNRLPKSISSIANMSILGQMAKDIASSPVGSYLLLSSSIVL